jgi:ABC-2 type transport system permease protein
MRGSPTKLLTAVRIRLALRNPAYIFFSVIMPIAFLFGFFLVFGHSGPGAVPYLVAAVIALTVMGSFWGLSLQLVLYREQGILRRLRLAPIGPTPLLSSSVLANFVLTLPTLVAELLLARWMFHLRSLGSPASLVLLVVAGGAAFSAFGLIVASVANSLQETQVINNALWTLFFFLSGATVPLPVFPLWVQKAAFFLPATYLVTGLERAMVLGAGPVAVAQDVIALAISFLAAFEISRRLFRWEPEEKLSPQARTWAALALIPFLLLGLWESHRPTHIQQMQQLLQKAAPHGFSFFGR